MSSPPKVRVKQGTVAGGVGILPNGNAYNYFKGIPYAKPPVGPLRFKKPVPLEHFNAPEIECIREGNECFQRDNTTGKYVGSEDCLFLNVYTPELSCGEELLPVMVFIHGGGFVTGSGNSDKYNPLYLMQENVVVVTLNYRLGPLGFLSFPEGEIPGNAGLKDQKLALIWVQENISKFGGDHKNVTLFGHSAGSISIHLHVLSENSRKLFHKAILQSGLANMTWTLEANPSEKAIQLSKSIGCHSDKPIEIIEFLQKHKDLKDFFNLKPTLDYNDFGFTVPGKPVVEEDSPEAVCTRASLESIRRNETSIDIPLIFGCASADGSIVLPAFSKILEKLDKSLSYFIPDGKLLLGNTKDLENSIRNFYFQDQKIDKNTLNDLNNLLTDFFYMRFAREAAELHSRSQQSSPLYFYIFDFVGGLNLHTKKYGLENIIEGTGHSDEMFYILQSQNTPSERWNESERQIVERMCKMWANFAKYNNPSTSTSNWKEVQRNQSSDDFLLQALVINDEMKMVENALGERMQFWKDLRKTVENLIYQSKIAT